MVDFLVIGPFSLVTYKDTFPFIKDRIIRLGWNRVGEFSNGSKFGNIVWFSTIGGGVPPMLQLKDCDIDKIKRYDNYDAINIDRTEDIPSNYYGEMGVPISFLEQWNPEQFDVLRVSANWLDDKFNGLKTQYIDDKKKYVRLLIKRK
jgi:hypothetical protein